MVKRAGVSLPPKLLKEFDKKIKSVGYRKRSAAIAELIRNFLDKKEKDEEIVGIIRILFNNRVNKNVLTIQHDYPCLILSSMQVNLDTNNCLATLVVKGRKKRIEALFEKIKSQDGIRDCKLVKY
ncbi:MAG: nickel-responsive transcriptional regulator NikR [Candidatus Woesearchaeota archaeon]